MLTTSTIKYSAHGFTLVEMAMVLIIVALLLGGLLPTISAQIEQKRIAETKKQLEEIKEALIGFAVINGRLPCPSSAAGSGLELYLGGGVPCTIDYNGLLPAVTLGLSGTDNSGFAVDPWGNRIRYAVTKWTRGGIDVFTTTEGMSATGISNLTPSGTEHLQICSVKSADSDKCSVANSSLASPPGVLAIIYSTGKNGSYGGTGNDEAENPNPNPVSVDNDRVFVSHTPTPGTAANGEFDDIVIWLSPNVLINRMVTAGRLP